MCKSVFFLSFQSLKIVGMSFRSPYKALEFKQSCLYEPCSPYILIMYREKYQWTHKNDIKKLLVFYHYPANLHISSALVSCKLLF